MHDEEIIPGEDANFAEENPIYSRFAIMFFAFFFSPVFGGVLLRQNLVEDRRLREGHIVIGVSIGFTVLAMIISMVTGKPSSSVVMPVNVGGAVVLGEYFFRKYFPEGRSEYKRLWKPFLISVLISLPFIILAIYAKSFE